MLLAAVACGKTPTDPTGTTAGTEASKELTGSAALVTDGRLKVGIVRDDEIGEEGKSAASEIYRVLLSQYPDGEVLIREDYVTNADEEKDNVEILIGYADRPESKAVFGELSYGDGVIRVVGNKIVIAAWSDIAYTSLKSTFTEMILLAADKQNLTLTDADNKSVTVNASVNGLPVVDGISPNKIHSEGEKAYQLYFYNATAENLGGYIEKMKADGYTCTMDRTVGNNRFTSFVGKDTSVTAYYTAANKTMRIIAEPESNLFVPKAGGAAVTTPMLTMIGRRFSTTETYLGGDAGAGLLCMMIRLSDGRFIVVDGGNYDGSSYSYAQALYAKMREQAPDPNNITVAAWYFSHTHNDHVGGFVSFAATYGSTVKVEAVLCNFPPLATAKKVNDGSANDRTRFDGALGQFTSKPKMYKIHTGQQYQIGDALMEVYYTQEDFLTKAQEMGDANHTTNWNNTSSIMSVDIAGQRIMFLGDAQEHANNTTANIYGSYLKSDIVQIAHHGGIGGTKAIYKAVDAAVGLFTTSDQLVDIYIDHWDYNRYMVADLNMKEYFNACDRVTTFALPYTPKSQGFVKTTVN